NSVTLQKEDELQSHYQALTLQRENLKLTAALGFTVASLASLQKEALHFLHQEEQDYLTSLSFAKRQHSYLLGRYVAKQALIRYNQNLTATVISIKSGIFENPIVHYPSFEKIQISLSHSEPLAAALAFPEEHPMGIDIELIRAQQCIEMQLT